MSKVLPIIALVLLLVAAGCVNSVQEPTGDLPEFIGADFYDLTNLESKHLLYFWSASCRYCIEKLPDLAILQEQLPEDVTMILVNSRDSRERLEPLLAGYPNLTVYLNGSASFMRYGVQYVPTYVFVDSTGAAQITHIGAMKNEDVLENLLRLD